MRSFKVYYINLDKSIERRNFMENQFKELNIPITRISAVYGKELPITFLKEAKSQHNILTHFPYLNDGEIGLTKTYFDLWKVVSKQKEDFSIILEDDALLNKNFFNDLPYILNKITTKDFVDISGRKGFLTLNKKELITKYLVPPLQTTGQIIGKGAAIKLSANLERYYSPIDVIKQDVFKHKTPVYVTNKSYVSSNDKALGGSTLQQKNKPIFKKVIREITRPFWQIVTLFTFKPYRCFRNFIFYKTAK